MYLRGFKGQDHLVSLRRAVFGNMAASNQSYQEIIQSIRQEKVKKLWKNEL